MTYDNYSAFVEAVEYGCDIAIKSESGELIALLKMKDVVDLKIDWDASVVTLVPTHEAIVKLLNGA